MAHDWVDVFTTVVLVASSLGGIYFAHHLSKHSALEDKVNQHDARLAGIEAALEWIRKTFNS